MTTRPVLLSRPVTRSPTSASMPSGMSTSMVLVFRSSWNFCLPLSSSSSASALDNSYVAVRSSRPLRVCVWLNVPFASAYQWMTVRSLSSPLPRQMRWLIGCAACLAVKSMRSESMLSPIGADGHGAHGHLVAVITQPEFESACPEHLDQTAVQVHVPVELAGGLVVGAFVGDGEQALQSRTADERAHDDGNRAGQGEVIVVPVRFDRSSRRALHASRGHAM